MARHYRSNKRKNTRNDEALHFEWDPSDCNRYLGPTANPHLHPKLAELVQRWWMEGDETDDIERKARNAQRRIFREGGNRNRGGGYRNNRNQNRNGERQHRNHRRDGTKKS